MNPYQKKRKIDSVEYKDIRISELLNWTQKSSDRLVLPSLQRKFVWKHQQICALFDSVMQGFPIGTFMFWKIGNNTESDKTVRSGMKFYEFLSEYNKRELGSGQQIPNSDLVGKKFIASIDGQQRLTSFNIALRGKYHLKKSNRELYLNLNFDSTKYEDEDKQKEKYEFKFLNPDEVTRKYERVNVINRNSEIWFKVKDVMNYKIRGYGKKNECSKKSNQFVDFAKNQIKNSLNTSKNSEKLLMQVEKKWNRYSEILHTLHYKIHYDTTISYFELEQADITDIVEIFIRLNNAGTKLTKTEMLMSVVSAIWPDARSKVDNLLKRINSEDGFEFDEDFVMRSALVLLDGKVLLNIKNVTKKAKQLEPNWYWIKRSILKTRDTLVGLNYSSRNLRSNNSVIPIVYYFSKKTDGGSANSAAREQMRLYLNSASILGVFGTHGDQALTNIRESMRTETFPGSKKYVLRPNQRNFNYKDIISIYKDELLIDTDKKPIEVDNKVIDNLLVAPYGPRTLPILNVLYPGIYSKYKDLPINQDHIYPKNGENYRLENGTRGRVDETMELFNKINSLPNLHLMWELENKEKQNLEPCVYFSGLESGSKDYIKKNGNIPLEMEELTYVNFIKFYNKRKEILKLKLYEAFHIDN